MLEGWKKKEEKPAPQNARATTGEEDRQNM